MQKVIFVALSSYHEAMRSCRDIRETLHHLGIEVTMVTPTRFRTEYTYVYFIDVYDPRCEQYLQGLRPDAIFGWRDLRERLEYRATDMTEYPECGLSEYIRKIHTGHEFLNKTLVMAGRGNGKSYTSLKYLERIMQNSVYGKSMYEPKLWITTASDARRAWEKQQAVYQYLMNDIETTKECVKNMPIIMRTNESGTLQFVWNPYNRIPSIKNVIFNNPATIVFWDDGTKTVVKCQEGETYDPEKGLAMAISKRMLGNKYDYYHTFKHWLKKCDG